MGYLLPTEYVQYGLSADTTDNWIAFASSLIDAHCRRSSLAPTQYVERMRLTAGSQAARLSYAMDRSAVTLNSVRVRYGKPRRGEAHELREMIATAFGVPGSWNNLDPGMIDVNPTTGELTFPSNFLGLDYNEVEITYTAGFAEIPPAVKTACAQVVKNAQAMPAASVKSSKMDTLQMEYFSASLIDPQVVTLLKPYIAQRIG
ncbi:MAG TPA: hypothetical protein VGC07_06660 [Granulicella sp.]